MAAKKQSNRRGTTKATSRRKTAGKKAAAKKTTTKKQGVTSGFQTEIILWIFFAASVILIISNLGMGGTVGGSISKASFVIRYCLKLVQKGRFRGFAIYCFVIGFVTLIMNYVVTIHR